ncbi:hypothetical protein [Salipiger aestuarii]|uniref:hypothetical protein n=1 Tax=Salipiger aestuarii TaxID=568098 RepID=UPI001680C60F|nr:hypothetical protein [Salipiger aestuarii]KAA8610836.1 hypothetical protein AL037_11575 [Salipiger aestuarii]
MHKTETNDPCEMASADRRPELKLVAGTTLAAPDVEFSPAWQDLDGLYNDSDVPLEGIFDAMVERQGGDLEEPCAAAQELLAQWNLDDKEDYLPQWRAAVDRLTPGRAAPAEPGAGDTGDDDASGHAEGDIGREDDSEPTASNDNGDAEAAEPADGDIPRVSGDAAPQFLNDAELIGEAPDDIDAFFATEATMLVGEMWGARDRRNTQDEAWTAASMSWEQWIKGFEKTPNAHAWGFSHHAQSKDKAGRCMVLGSSVGGARKAKAMDTMYAMGLDVDSGVKLDTVLDKLEELGLLCCVHTSYNHGKTGIALKRDEVLRKLKITGDPTMDDIRQYLHEHDKNRYEPTFIAGISIKDAEAPDLRWREDSSRHAADGQVPPDLPTGRAGEDHRPCREPSGRSGPVGSQDHGSGPEHTRRPLRHSLYGPLAPLLPCSAP